MYKEIEIDIAIALCSIIEELEVFIKDLNKLRKDGFFTTYDTLYDLEIISDHGFCFGKRKIKRFYKENQNIINKIKEYIPISIFIKHLGLDENCTKTINDLCQYLLKNKDNKLQILEVLEKIKGLGFQYIRFDESIDFSKDEYTVYKNASANHQEIYFLENMKRIPTYGTEAIKYQSQGSSYRIPFRFHPDSRFIFEDYIEVNNLLFDVDTLPQIRDPWRNTFTEMIDKLTSDKEQENECNQITNSVYLTVGLANLEKGITSMDHMAKELICFEERKELNEALLHMKVELTRIRQLSDGYNKQIMSEDSLITEDMLKRERIAYQDRTNLADFD